MTAYLIATYDVTDPEQFAGYSPGSIGLIGRTIAKHGGQTLVAAEPETVTGEDRQRMVVIRFPSVEAARAWTEDPEYAPAKAIRLASTANTSMLIAPALPT
jgi:uncharacterized protein (DUF1330 family)